MLSDRSGFYFFIFRHFYIYHSVVEYIKNEFLVGIIWSKIYNAPTGIWTRVAGLKGRYAWPDYTIGANSMP